MNENLPNAIQNLPKKVQKYAKYWINSQRIAKNFLNFTKVAKFRQIWSQWLYPRLKKFRSSWLESLFFLKKKFIATSHFILHC